MSPDFRERARSAYELGRFLTALRVLTVVVIAAAAVMFETSVIVRTAAIAGGLAVVAIAVRWRMYRGFQVVSSALWAGTLPLVAALSICRFAPACPPNVLLAVCGGLGLASGGALGVKLATDQLGDWRQVGAGLVVAGLMSSLGCSALGLGAMAGAALGLAVGLVGVGAWKNWIPA